MRLSACVTLRWSVPRGALNPDLTELGLIQGMGQLPPHLTPEAWVNQAFSSAEAQRGGVVKRKIRDIERLAGRAMFEAEIRRRGFQAVENGRHIVVFCNALPIRRVL